MTSSMIKLRNSGLAKALQLALAAGFLCLCLIVDASAQHSQHKADNLFKKPVHPFTPPTKAPGESLAATSVLSAPIISSHNNNSLPQHMAYSEYRENDFELIYNNTITYTAKGEIETEIFREPSGENTERYRHKYDSYGNLTEFLIDEWEDDDWVQTYGSNNQFTYNTEGGITEVVVQYFDKGAWINSHKLIFTYDNSKRRTEEVYHVWNESDWDIEDRALYIYTGTQALPGTIVIQDWENNAYVNSDRYIDIVWHNAEEVASFISQEWVNNAWENVFKSNTTFDDLGGSVTVTQEWVNNTWVNDGRTSTTNDEHGNQVAFKSEDWSNNAWAFTYESEYNLTYNEEGDLTERVRRYRYNHDEIWRNEYKEVYSNFFRVTTSLSGVKAKMAVNVYPNPISDALYIEANIAESTQLQLTDITGKVVFTRTLVSGNADAQRVNLSALPAGMYVLSLRNNKTSHTSKILKQ
jgi:hypothetical protein